VPIGRDIAFDSLCGFGTRSIVLPNIFVPVRRCSKYSRPEGAIARVVNDMVKLCIPKTTTPLIIEVFAGPRRTSIRPPRKFGAHHLFHRCLTGVESSYSRQQANARVNAREEVNSRRLGAMRIGYRDIEFVIIQRIDQIYSLSCNYIRE